MRLARLLVTLAFGIAPFAAAAQTPAAQPGTSPLPVVITPTPSAPKLSAAALGGLLAPIALYPDALLAGILAASTYPAQIVEAARNLSDPAYAGMSLVQLQNEAATRGWDGSVAGLLAFPDVLRALDANLDWTDQLGRAYAAQPGDVMVAVQSLRQRAQQSGALTTGPDDTVSNDGDDIQIAASSPGQAAVPSYDPACVYGPQPDCGAGQDGVAWADAAALPSGYVTFGSTEWVHHRVGHGFGVSRSVRAAAFRPARLPMTNRRIFGARPAGHGVGRGR